MSSAANWTNSFQEFLTRRGKIQSLAELTAVQNLQETAAENRRNNEAEGASVRRALWGEQAGSAEKTNGDSDVGTTVLGDITHPAPIIMHTPNPPQQNPLITAAALALTLGVGGAAGYMLTNKGPAVADPQPPAAQPGFNDSSVEIGLGRIEDYILKKE